MAQIPRQPSSTLKRDCAKASSSLALRLGGKVGGTRKIDYPSVDTRASVLEAEVYS